MQRRRDIAGSPARSTGATWTAISELVVTTLERSSTISAPEVQATMDRAAGVGRGLVAAGHLTRDPLVVVGDDFWLEIFVIAGDASLSLEENSNPVPGGASVSSWRVHLPAVGGLTKAVKDAASGDEHLSAEPPTATAADKSASGPTINTAALAAWAQEER